MRDKAQRVLMHVLLVGAYPSFMALGDSDRDGLRRLVQQLPSINVLVLTRLMLLLGKLLRATAVTKVYMRGVR